MGRRRGSSKGIVFMALGLGLLMYLLLPEKILIVLLASSLVICGAALCKS